MLFLTHLCRWFNQRAVWGLALAAILLSFGAGPARAYNDAQPQYITKSADEMTSAVKAGIATMKGNGVYAATQKHGGENFYKLLAIAIHESGGRAGAVNGQNVAYCAYQIYYTNLKGYKTYTGGDPDVKSEHDFYVKLLTDPDLCARTGARVLTDGLRKGYVAGICQYGGQVTQYKDTGTCFLVHELARIEQFVRAVEGAGSVPAAEVITGSGPDAGKVKITDENGKTVKVLNCGGEDEQKDLVVGLIKSASAFKNAVVISTEAVRRNVLSEQANSKASKYKGDAGKKFCLSAKYKNFFKYLKELITDLEKFIMDMIATLIENILEQICSVVAQSINALLEMICIPLPSTPFGLDLFGIPFKPCNGISLKKFINVESGTPVTAEELLSKAGVPDTLLPVDALPSTRWSVPGLVDNLMGKVPTETKILF